MKRNLVLACMLTFLLFAGGITQTYVIANTDASTSTNTSANEEEDTVVREYIFTTNTKNFNYTENQNITVKDVDYEAVNIEYELLEDSFIEKEVIYYNQVNKDIPMEIIEGEETLEIKTVEWDTVYLTKEVSKTADTEPSFTSSISLDYGATGQIKDVIVERTDYILPFVITGKFYGNSSIEYYTLDSGDKYPNNASSPIFQGYEDVLIEYLGLTGDYRITGGSWQGDYVKEGDNIVRYAEFTGERKTNIYTATYTGEVYTGTAVYSNESSNVYEVKAMVTYEKAGFTFTEKIMIGAGTFLLILIIAILIYYFAKRKRDKALN